MIYKICLLYIHTYLKKLNSSFEKPFYNKKLVVVCLTSRGKYYSHMYDETKQQLITKVRPVKVIDQDEMPLEIRIYFVILQFMRPAQQNGLDFTSELLPIEWRPRNDNNCIPQSTRKI